MIRPYAWAFLWSVVGNAVTMALGWPLLLRVAVGTAICVAALNMTRHRSLAWRWAVIRYWDRLELPMVYDEDGRLRSNLLPFERLCVWGDREGPIQGHVHTRTLILGRDRKRAITRWR